MNKTSEFFKLFYSKEPKTLLQHLLDYKYKPSRYLFYLEMLDYYSDLYSRFYDYSEEREYFLTRLSIMERRWIPFESSTYGKEIQIIKDYLGRE